MNCSTKIQSGIYYKHTEKIQTILSRIFATSTLKAIVKENFDIFCLIYSRYDYMKETNKTPTPIIPDAFVQGAAAARELAVVENKQKQNRTRACARKERAHRNEQ